MHKPLETRRLIAATVGLTSLGLVTSARALDTSVSYLGADLTQSLLGDGTGVIVGIIDSGIDDAHPGLNGNDSLGRPRLVAEANFVPDEPGNTGDDIAGHGTAVMGVVGGYPVANYKGVAPDVRYVNARVLDSSNSFSSTSWVANGIGFAIDNGADVMNLSLNTGAASNGGNASLDLMLDWAAHSRGVLSAVSAGNIGQANPNTNQVRSPASAYNVLAVGRTTADFQNVHTDSAQGPTSDGRIKPDLLAPGTSITTLSDDWEGPANSNFRTMSGTSFAAPHVSGLLAQQIDYGRSNGLSTDPRVLKATMMNSADKVLRKHDWTWRPHASSTNAQGVLEITSPLDNQQGAGQVDALALYDQYSAGEHEAGLVPEIGWDLDTIVGEDFIDYVFDGPLQGGSFFTATLNWFRDVDRYDPFGGGIGSNDFFSDNVLDNLDLTLLLDGDPIAISMSDIDPVEHLYLELPETGEYVLRVNREQLSGTGSDELYALAWSGTLASMPVPEPGTASLLVLSLPLLWRRHRRPHVS